MSANLATRREFLRAGAAASLALAAGPAAAARPKGKATACVMLWLGGGCAQIDTFDPKGRGDGKKQAGCYYQTIETAIKNVHVCEHLKRTAPLLDRFAILRSLSHDISSEHGAASNLMHTGRRPSETV